MARNSHFTVLSLNTHKGFSLWNRRFMLHELREAVRGVSADVVMLQEVIGEHELHASRQRQWPSEPHYEFLADSIWQDHAYGKNAVYPEGHHGNAVLSKFPIVSWVNHDVSTPTTHSAPAPEKRGLLHCVMEPPGIDRPLHVICVHLGLSETQRQHQVEALIDTVNREVPPDAPLVVGGDFNDWRHRLSAPLKRGCGLREVFQEQYGRVARSFPSRWPLLRLDRIYVRHLRPRRPRVLAHRPWSHLSDHAGLIVELSP